MAIRPAASPGRIEPCSLSTPSSPQIAQQRITLLAQVPQPLSLPATVLTRDYPDIAGHLLGAGKTRRISEKHFGRQLPSPAPRPDASAVVALGVFVALALLLVDPVFGSAFVVARTTSIADCVFHWCTVVKVTSALPPIPLPSTAPCLFTGRD